ncbi:helix-turn-helix domain-containing protein [Tunicatimonas pelagia]|uniref:helix-turn-helix domain-containing protein n=1 Tax=Tunicatimonas pelagia TaxID=931531 RepID=UPI002666ED53|nr:helix-turn-helix transcriptional regulator [Tunicatimonas pelagia]WKN46431.1 helix-turn-helix transcriptional regulator [Tunicatimonas pelagia]
MEKEQFKRVFATNLRKFRKVQKLTQTVLAAKADTDERYIQALEAGTNAPSLYVAWKLAVALGVPVDTLCSEDGTPLEG